jgi:hypothetical protein
MESKASSNTERRSIAVGDMSNVIGSEGIMLKHQLMYLNDF